MDIEELKQKISEAKYQSKPDDENTFVFYDKDGNWIFEVYTAGHKVKRNGVD